MTKYERHIRQLCRKHGIEIRYSKSYGNNEAYIHDKVIWIDRHITNLGLYAAALHEIGHVLNEHRRFMENVWRLSWNNKRNLKKDITTTYVMRKEILACKTARKLAKWWGPRADREALLGLFTYVYGYNRFHKKPLVGVTNRWVRDIQDFLMDDSKIVSNILSRMYDWA